MTSSFMSWNEREGGVDLDAETTIACISLLLIIIFMNILLLSLVCDP